MIEQTTPIQPHDPGPVGMVAPGGPVDPWIGMRKSEQLFENDEIRRLLKRGIFYVRAGLPVHFEGAAGQGKTSLALAIARRLGRPIAMMTGNDWLTSEDMIGKEVGQTSKVLVDKYVQSVRRTEKRIERTWGDSILATAMEQGQTLIYDEFTRTNAAANGLLLSVLEEGVLVSTDRINQRSYLEAHPDFRIILTSNPVEYAGVNAPPDALLDRMITFRLAPYSPETQAGIVAARSGLDEATAACVGAQIDRIMTQNGSAEKSLRAAILIARAAQERKRAAELTPLVLAKIIADVLAGRGHTINSADLATHIAQHPVFATEMHTEGAVK